MIIMIIKITIIYLFRRVNDEKFRSSALDKKESINESFPLFSLSLSLSLFLSVLTLYYLTLYRLGKRSKRRNNMVHKKAQQGETSRHSSNVRRK